MRALAIVLIAACGRFEFSTSADGATDQTSDGAPSPLLVGCKLGLAMNEASWSGGLVDRCGGDNPGSALGGAMPVDDGERGRVGELVGGASCIVVKDAPELRGGAALTISAWVRPESPAANSFGIVSKRTDYGVDAAYSVFIWTSKNGAGTVNHLYVDIDTENDRFENPSDELLGTWHQVTVVYDGALAGIQRVAIYVDGTFRTNASESSPAIPTPSTPPDLYVGCLPLGAPAQGLVGRIDDVMFWDRALPASEVLGWFDATR
jgi:hypothetical protein